MTHPTIGEATSGQQRIAAIVLAAGASARFGQCKQLLEWRGKAMLAHVTDVALEAGLDPVIVVLGCQAEETYAALGDRPVQKLVNWRWEDGMSTSVQTGLSAVPPQADGALFLQCDQPRVTTDLLHAIVGRFEQTGNSIVHPTCQGQRGTPVLFPRRFFPELSAVTGDEGGRSLIRRHPMEVATVAVNNPGLLIDVDTPADYEQLTSSARKTDGSASASILRSIRHLVVDMDGVLWHGDRPLPGLERFFAFLGQHDITFVLATNNSSRTPEQYKVKLADFGVEVPLERILTSSVAAAAYLTEVAPPASRVYVVGGEGVRKALEERSFVLDDQDADYVVVGWDTELTWQSMTTAAFLIQGGAAFIGTNPDLTYPTSQGLALGNGAILVALEAATGVTPVVVGKPEPRMYEEALRRMGATVETTAMIGDRIDTDIAGAASVGLTTVLTLSGIATTKDLEASSIKPDLVYEDVGDLVRHWEEVLAAG